MGEMHVNTRKGDILSYYNQCKIECGQEGENADESLQLNNIQFSSQA